MPLTPTQAKALYIGLGSLSGAMTAGSLGVVGQLLASRGSRKATNKRMSEEDLVDAKKFVAKYEPGIKVVTNYEDYKKAVNPGLIDAFFAKRLFKNKGLGFEDTGAGNVIASPSKANMYGLAHEIGHYRDLTKDRNTMTSPVLSHIFNIDKLTGSTVRREAAAWEKAPVKAKGDIGEKALGTYQNVQTAFRIGALTGAILGGARYARRIGLL